MKAGGSTATAFERAERAAGWPLPLACAPALVRRAAQAADDVFTVGNYPVEARADNAVAAKDRALADGQQAASARCSSGWCRSRPMRASSGWPASRRATSIDGVKVRSERNSSTDYIASLDFSFQSKAVRDLLRREGIPFTDEQAPALTVVPVWRAGAARPPQGRGRLDQCLEGPRPGARADARQAAGAQEGDRARHHQGACRRRRQRHPLAALPPTAASYVLIAVAEHDAAAKPAQRHAERPRRRRRLHAQARPTGSMRPIPATPASLRPSSRSASSRAAGRPSSRAAAAAAAAGRVAARRHATC